MIVFDNINNYINEVIELSFNEINADDAKQYVSHIDCFLTWLIKNNHTTLKNIDNVKNGYSTANDILINDLNGILNDTIVKPDIVEFVKSVYEEYKNIFIKKVASDLGKLHLEFILSVIDYNKISYIIDELYQKNNKHNDSSIQEGLDYFNNNEFDKAFNILKNIDTDLSNSKLGYMYLKGLSVNKDIKLAINLLDKSIINDNIENILFYAKLCKNKEVSTGPSGPTFISLYERAISLGCIEAMIELADHYYEADINSTNGKSIELYLRAARLNNSYSQSKAGLCYLNSIGVSQNYKRAFKWLKKGYESNDYTHIYELALCYELGFGTNINIDEAIKLHKVAYLEYSNFNSCFSLGKLMINDDYKLGLSYIELACNSSIKEALTFHADLIYKDDENKSFELYKKASELKDHNALYKMGFFYENGILVEKDNKQAFKYYLESSKYKNCNALWKVGFFYELGIETSKDSSRAKNYYISAIEQGCTEASIDLDFIKFINHLNRETKDTVDQSYNSILNNINSIHVNYRLGLCYKDGLGLEKDLDKSIEHLMLVAKDNYLDSRDVLKKVKIEKLNI